MTGSTLKRTNHSRTRAAGRPRPARERSHVLLACALLAMFALPAAVKADPGPTVYVDQSNAACTDLGLGTQSQPYCTINAAAAAAAPGTTVLVAAGTYEEEVAPASGTSGSPIVLRPVDGATVTVTGRQHGFYLSRESWVTIQGFRVTGTTEEAFYASKSNHITIAGNTVTFSGQPTSGGKASGIRLATTVDSIVSGNVVYHNTDYGIYLATGANRNEIVGNTVSLNARQFQRAASGIRVHSSDANTISKNVSFDNEDSGIEIVTGSDDNLVVSNVTYDNGDHGVDILNSLRQRVVANTVYRNVAAGINVEGTSTSTTLANNVSADNAIAGPRTRGNIRVDSGSTSGTTIDYDVVDQSVPDVMVVWGSTSYFSLSAFQAATGQEMHGVEADPGWLDRESGDFHLTGGSPAIDSANSGASGQPSTDVEGNARVDDPATPNTGVGPRPYDDRGAYEFQPSEVPPTAALTVTPQAGDIPLQVTADASASTDNDGIASYRFDFGDGTPIVGPQSNATATHTYATPGTRTVTVTVTDVDGLTDTATAQVVAVDPPPTAALTVTPSSGEAPLDVTADASASTDVTGIASYTFTFGDGTPAVGPQPGATATHTYATGGTFTATVTVRDDAGQTSQATQQVVVSAGGDDPPQAALTVTPSSGTIPLAVSADASASTDDVAIATYEFDFGDGSPTVGPQTSATAPHTYTAAGTFTVRVTVRDAAGQPSQATQQVVAGDPPPTAALTVTPSSGPAPLAVTADASASTDDSGIVSYLFDFGDGTPAVGPQPGATATHTFTSGGTRTVTVTVTDTAGQTSSAGAQVSVIANLVGNPGFETETTGWNTSGSGSGVTLARVAGGHSGSWAVKLTNGGTANTTCALNDSPDWVRPTASGAYTASVWVRADTAGASLKLRLREWNGTTLVGTATATAVLTTSWQQVTVSYTPGAPGSSNLDLNVYLPSADAPPGACFYADDVVVTLE